MEKKKESGSRKRRQGEEQKESSFSKVTKNEDPVEGRMTLDRMSEDASILFSHFPEEIWVLIIDKVTDSKSLTSLMRASAVFRNLLLPRRVEFLFPEVWQVLGLKFENQEDEVYRLGTPEYFNLKHPDIDWRPRILTLREVCKSWCRGVDEFYEDLPEHYRMEVDKDIEDGEPSVKSRWDYKTITKGVGKWMNDAEFLGYREDVEHFMDQFDMTHFLEDNQRNPVIHRSISISHEDGDRESFIFDLLEKYGHHFWHCDLKISDYFPTQIAFYTELKELLELLPNLKTLKLVCCPEQRKRMQELSRKCENIKLPPVPSETDAFQLEQDIASHPLPKLHQLQFLSLKNFPGWIFNALISRNSHISMLEVLRDDVQQGYDFFSFTMPNLKQLSMKFFSKSEFENLNKPEVNWSLEKIYLNLRPCPFIPWSQIFSLLEAKWADTLTNVAIFTPPTAASSGSDNINIMNDGSSITLNLAKVQRFLFSTQEISSLDFILPMKNLKVLQVALRKENQFNEAMVKQLLLIQENQVVQFLGYFERFHKSNIWNLFPNLKSFELGNAGLTKTYFPVTYTRQDFEDAADTRRQSSRNKFILWFSDCDRQFY